MNKDKVTIFKIGGDIIENDEKLTSFLQSLVKIKGKKILVHGGGKIASEISLNLGIKPKMVEGRRLTDFESLKVMIMVYGGLINKSIVARLQGLKQACIGLTGADLATINAKKRVNETYDYGYVGDIESVDSTYIMQFIEQGILPVFSPLSFDSQGQLLNTNADTIASSIAQALSPHYRVDLAFCFDLPGVLEDPNDKQSLIGTLSETRFKKEKADGHISAGMVPKLENGFAALKSGVEKVIVTSSQATSALELGNPMKGTELCLD